VGPLNRFEPDDSCRVAADASVVIGGSPLRLFRLSDGGRELWRRVANGDPLPDGHQGLTERLLDAGVIHPLPPAHGGPSPAEVTLVVPAYRADPDRVLALARATAAARTVVVDDASPTEFPGDRGLDVVRLARNGGPGAARQAGLDQVLTPFVAFVDTDVTLESGWLDPLLVHFTDPRCGLVAPRICARDAPGPLARFEAVRNPLDLGPQRARVRAGSRVSYVPGAVLVCRTEALRDIAGFDPGLRLGEDVDLVWRLDAAGWRCRYEPGVVARHDTRSALGAWIRQRVGYGSSAPTLAIRHPGTTAPARVSVWSAASWMLAAGGAPAAGVALAAGSTAVLAARFPDVPKRWREATRLGGLGHLHAGELLAQATTRVWWPIGLAAAVTSRRARRVLLAAVAIPTLREWWPNRRRIGPLLFAALRLLDDGAYGAGVWLASVQARDVRALRPELTGWPRPRLARYDRRQSRLR